ncbi:MAG: hypothetical protein KAR62_07645 [Sphingomonadales bacterium]|nr:hypothetical protein [Sphingomonadales bacterium]
MVNGNIHMVFVRFALVLSFVLAPMFSQPAFAVDGAMEHMSIDTHAMDTHAMEMNHMSIDAMTMPISCEEHCADETNTDQTCLSNCLQNITTPFANVTDNVVEAKLAVASHFNKTEHMAHLAKIGSTSPPPRI